MCQHAKKKDMSIIKTTNHRSLQRKTINSQQITSLFNILTKIVFLNPELCDIDLIQIKVMLSVNT